MTIPREDIISTLRSSPSWESRRDAANQLGRTGDSDSTDHLVSALKDPVKHVRAAAAEALGKIGDAKATVPLLAAIADRQYEVSTAARRVLEKMLSKGLVPFIDALKHPQGHIREQAAIFLAGCGNSLALDALIETLSDWHAGRAAADALGKIADRRAIKPLLLAWIKGTDVVIDASRLDALKQIDPHWPESLEANELVPELMTALLDQNANIRRNAKALLLKIAPDWHRSAEAIQYVPDLIAAVRIPAPDLACDAYDMLQAIDPNWPSSAASRRQVNDFLDALGSQEPVTRILASLTLSRMGEKNAVLPLLYLLEHEANIDVVSEVVKALGQLGDARAIEPLIKRLSSQYNHRSGYHLECIIAEVLGSFHDLRAVPILLWQLRMTAHVMWNVYRYGAGASEEAQHCHGVTYKAIQEIVANGIAHEIVPLLLAPLMVELPFDDGDSILGSQFQEDIVHLLVKIGGDCVSTELRALVERSANQPHVITVAKKVLDCISDVKQ